MTNEPKRILAIVKLDPTSDSARIHRDLKGIKDSLQTASVKKIDQAFASKDLHLIGMFMVTPKPLHIVREIFETSRHSTNNDSILLIELGFDFESTVKFSSARTWLQRN